MYAASYPEIAKVVALLTTKTDVMVRPVLGEFAEWLGESYGEKWSLTNAVYHGVGIHNGQIHRSLSQIQLRLFDMENDGLDTIVSTSSLIEGVNTSAEAVVLWRNRKGGRGNPYLDSFMYKNIIGRGGRMFKFFVGQIYLLEEPPEDSETQLDIEFSDSALGGMDEIEHKDSLSSEQIAKIILFRERMTELLGPASFSRLYKGAGVFQGSNSDLILEIAESMAANPSEWNGLAFLNTNDPNKWERILYLLIKLQPSQWDIEFKKFVRFVKVLSKNWKLGLPELLRELAPDVDVDIFFKLEKNVTFKLSALLHDVNELQKELFRSSVDVSPFVSKLSHAFLPSVVYQLEEYGLPRMISRKIHVSGLFNFEADFDSIHSALHALNRMGRKPVLQLGVLSKFEKSVVDYFFDGIESNGDRDISSDEVLDIGNESIWDTAAREAVEHAMESSDWNEEDQAIEFQDRDDMGMGKTVYSRDELVSYLEEVASEAFYANCIRDEGEFIAECDENDVVEDVLSDYKERLIEFFAPEEGEDDELL